MTMYTIGTTQQGKSTGKSYIKGAHTDMNPMALARTYYTTQNMKEILKNVRGGVK
jgi:predicted porin